MAPHMLGKCSTPSCAPGPGSHSALLLLTKQYKVTSEWFSGRVECCERSRDDLHCAEVTYKQQWFGSLERIMMSAPPHPRECREPATYIQTV